MTPGAPDWLPGDGRLRQLFGKTALYPYYKVALARVLAGALPTSGRCSILDVGTGDGLLAGVLRLRPRTIVMGVETYVRSAGRPAIATALFDGRRLPFADASFDFALLCDVLHHAEAQEKLLEESLRIASRAVLVKDHVFRGRRQRTLLHALDLAGNLRFGVKVPATYLDEAGWARLFSTHPEVSVETTFNLALRSGVMASLFPVSLEVLHVLRRPISVAGPLGSRD